MTSFGVFRGETAYITIKDAVLDNYEGIVLWAMYPFRPREYMDILGLKAGNTNIIDYKEMTVYSKDDKLMKILNQFKQKFRK
jgi:hypothetical protein